MRLFKSTLNWIATHKIGVALITMLGLQSANLIINLFGYTGSTTSTGDINIDNINDTIDEKQRIVIVDAIRYVDYSVIADYDDSYEYVWLMIDRNIPQIKRPDFDSYKYMDCAAVQPLLRYQSNPIFL